MSLSLRGRIGIGGTSKSSTMLSREGWRSDLGCGRWCGSRLEIVDSEVFDPEGWSDATEVILNEVEESLKAIYGQMWRKNFFRRVGRTALLPE